MTPLLDRRGAETDERSESSRWGGGFYFKKYNWRLALIRLHLWCSLIRATPPIKRGIYMTRPKKVYR